MHVMHILGTFGPGGAEMGVVRLIKAFQGEHVTHSVCSIGPDIRMKDLLAPGTRCYTLGFEGPCRTAFVQLARLLKTTKTKIAHVNNLAPWLDAALASRLASCKCVETFHGVESRLERFPLSRRFLWKVASALTASITAVGSSAADLFVRLTGIDRGKVRVFPNGVDTDLFRPCHSAKVKRCLRKGLNLPEKGLLLGCVAALRPVKNHQGLVKAFAKATFHETGFGFYDDIYLIIVGDGPLEPQLKTLTRKLGIAGKVTFLGRRNDVQKVMQALDLLVLNSETEGMSYAILEAMASGLPVIATNVGANEDLIEHGVDGYIVPQGDIEALACRLVQASKNRSILPIIGENARNKVVQSYSLGKMVSSYEKLYSELLEKSKTAREAFD